MRRPAPGEIYAFAILGILCGLLGAAFVHAVSSLVQLIRQLRSSLLKQARRASAPLASPSNAAASSSNAAGPLYLSTARTADVAHAAGPSWSRAGRRPSSESAASVRSSESPSGRAACGEPSDAGRLPSLRLATTHQLLTRRR